MRVREQEMRQSIKEYVFVAQTIDQICEYSTQYTISPLSGPKDTNGASLLYGEGLNTGDKMRQVSVFKPGIFPSSIYFRR